MISGSDQPSDFQVYSVYGGAYETFSIIDFDNIDDRPFSLLQRKPRTIRLGLQQIRPRGASNAARNGERGISSGGHQ